MQPAPSPVKRLALASGLEVFQPESLKSAEVAARVSAARADVMVVAAYGLILPQSVLASTPHGAFNVHASLLPRWRGAAPIQRALLAGDQETGISIMQMDAGLDTGPIVAQRSMAIASDDDAGTLHDRLATLGAEVIVVALRELAAGRTRPIPQGVDGVTYARKIAKQDTVLDWSQSAPELERAVRAFRPSPGASTLLDGAPVKVWRAQALEEHGEPGTLLRANDALVIACARGALAVTELQMPGGRRLGAAEFLRGHRLAPGVHFGRLPR